MRRRIALYGKGGIGKTTLAVNLALTAAAAGRRTLLVGCDPKRDTTRLLLRTSVPSIVERYDALLAGSAKMEEVCVPARENLWCCEAGGPKPGVGCAGRGVLIALELLEKRGMLCEADVVLYDVLGDVVCGGFATPVTRGYTDRVFVVTSGEQASLLAANNILAGMSAVGGKIGGLIRNDRGFEGEGEYIEAFSKAVETPVIGRVPYSQRIKLAEIERRAICEAPDAQEERRAVRALAQAILEPGPAASPRPLSQDALYDMIAEIRRCRRDA